MIWVFGVIGYMVAVATIVRFFQFVSDTDRSIEEFWVSRGGIAQMRGRVLENKSSSMQGAKRRHQR